MRHAELELAVLGRRVVERLEPTEERAHVADQETARVVVVPQVAVHFDPRLERLVSEILGCRPDVRESSVLVLRAAVRVADHARVEAGACHHREVLAVHLPHVEPLLPAVQSDRHGLGDVVGDVEVGREEVRRAGG